MVLDFIMDFLFGKKAGPDYGSLEAVLSQEIKPGPPEEVKAQLEKYYKRVVKKEGKDSPLAKGLRAYIDRGSYLNAPFTKSSGG